MRDSQDVFTDAWSLRLSLGLEVDSTCQGSLSLSLGGPESQS